MLGSVARFVFDSIGCELPTRRIAGTLTSDGRKSDSRTIERYLDALLELDLPFLYPYRAYAGTAKYIETGMSPRALTMPFGGDDMIQPARFKGVRDWLDEHIWSTGARDIPALRWVFNAGVVIWLMLLSAHQPRFLHYSGEMIRPPNSR